jgi:hypothetical protein
MHDLVAECLAKGIPVINSTRTEEDYRAERFKQEEENLANHVFISGVKDEGCRIDPETNQVIRRISFDYNFFQSCLHLGEMHDFAGAFDAEHKQRLADQLFAALERAEIRL